MEKNELQMKIKKLEKELENYYKKEEYTEAGIKKTKEVYDIARQNAEKIIFKAVTFTHDFKKSISETLYLIQKDKNNFEKYVDEFIEKNNYFLTDEIDELKELIKKIVDKIYKDTTS
ncbi:hypothetical protein [Spiroplasma taiwanense]|uniref:Uncharacterized protein n=1 Tax=Spiroplasma taiwanense CT-1 TaxID=1276220 RepID=S5MHT3_9MOLU|nr:hypothetical protein [Spiroplasma taiwanense]AGR41445.1 hypothetical protein STAIW_v1c08590 [Spiroplasma taiwanense CT-1]